MTSNAAQCAAPSPKVRSAEREPNTKGEVRRCVDAIVELTGVRRSEARAQVRAHVTAGRSLADLEVCLNRQYRLEPYAGHRDVNGGYVREPRRWPWRTSTAEGGGSGV